jgi:4'-phosphopantetheinyl transferase EntD
MRLLGIDLERHKAGSLLTLADVLDQEGSARGNELFLTYAFSAKEAVFKAQFPIAKARLGFADVTLEWQRLDSSFFQAVARTKDFELVVRGCVPTEPWVVSAAGQVF